MNKLNDNDATHRQASNATDDKPSSGLRVLGVVDSSSVKKIRVRLDLRGADGSAIEEFDVPSEHFATILDAMSNVHRLDKQYKWEGMGEVTLHTATDSVEISIYMTKVNGASRVIFRVGGDLSTYYLGGDLNAFERLLRNAHDAAKSK